MGKKSLGTRLTSWTLSNMHSLTTEARHSGARHSRARHSRARHSRARHSRARHSGARHSRARHSRARHSVARHSRARYSRARHSGASVQLVIVNLIQSQPPFSSMGTQVFIVLCWSLECVILIFYLFFAVIYTVQPKPSREGAWKAIKST